MTTETEWGNGTNDPLLPKRVEAPATASLVSLEAEVTRVTEREGASTALLKIQTFGSVSFTAAFQ